MLYLNISIAHSSFSLISSLFPLLCVAFMHAFPFQISCLHATGLREWKTLFTPSAVALSSEFPLFLPHLVSFNSFSQHSWTRSWAHGIDHKGQNITLLCWWMQPRSTWAHKTPRAWFGAQQSKCLIITAQISHIHNKRHLLHYDGTDTLYYIFGSFLSCGDEYKLNFQLDI